jgi:urease accessory protein
MLHLRRRTDGAAAPDFTLTLPFDRRQKSRLRARLDGAGGQGALSATPGEEVAIELERGSCLRDGDRLLTESGQVVLVRAATESVSLARSSDALQLARGAYHLGNRHVPLQIAPGELRYQHDHVLDEMVRQLGLLVSLAELPFEPEPGAYGTSHSHLSHAGHSHGSRGHIHDPLHAHPHDHSHPHAHSHDHEHDHEH